MRTNPGTELPTLYEEAVMTHALRPPTNTYLPLVSQHSFGVKSMANPVEIILDTAKHHPYSKMWENIARAVAEKLGLELDILEEDYMFAIDHGITDDLGMAALPQIMVKMNDGSIKPLLAQLPLGSNYKPDPEKAVEIAIEKVEEFSSN
ncbi:MAG: hypothetical protein F7B60_07165 [Desulfurococcales archaeon]|nr:hypothetical protein [Desulfurococcales archaeon]